ncbi:hypothetical protein BK133_05715 [Paenibacillus sp. FSL H8-0548]|nr:hypothetical protein BK133_05715 [Paenibacillus sp. FSL H8-0548]
MGEIVFILDKVDAFRIGKIIRDAIYGILFSIFLGMKRAGAAKGRRQPFHLVSTVRNKEQYG